MNYTATFPILISVEGTPTYFLSLKDNAGLVKMYAFVSVQNIQHVSVTDSTEGVVAAMENYKKLMNLGLNTTPDVEKTTETVTATVEEIYTAIIEGNSYYYIIADGNLYIAPISSGKYVLPILKVGDNVSVTYYNMNSYREVVTIEEVK